MLKQLRFCRLYIYSFLEILLNYFGEIFQSFHNTTNLQGCCSKTGRVDFPEKRSNKGQIFMTSLLDFIKFYRRKREKAVSFAFVVIMKS